MTYRYFGTKPTSVNSESNVRIGDSAMPWETESESGKVYKYQYHPHGDKSQPLRAAPSALNTVIVPDVTLPKVRVLSWYLYKWWIYSRQEVDLILQSWIC